MLSYQAHLLISMTPVIVTRKKMRRNKTRTSLTLTISVNDEWCSDNYHFEAHDRLRRGRSEKIILACYLSTSINELVIELSGISVFTVLWINSQVNVKTTRFLELIPSKTVSTYCIVWDTAKSQKNCNLWNTVPVTLCRVNLLYEGVRWHKQWWIERR